MHTSPSTPPTPKTLRSDGVEARNRLLDSALALFAEKGFAKTSTREIAQAAQVNIASISYYFGDKAGLYKAVFTDPRCNPSVPPDQIDDASQPLLWALGNRYLAGGGGMQYPTRPSSVGQRPVPAFGDRPGG